jgi:hypothetical protein
MRNIIATRSSNWVLRSTVQASPEPLISRSSGELAPVVAEWHPIDPDDRDVDEMRCAGPQRGLDYSLRRVDAVHDRVHTLDGLGKPFAGADIASDVLRGTDPAAPAAEHAHLSSGVEQMLHDDTPYRAGATGDQDQIRH